MLAPSNPFFTQPQREILKYKPRPVLALPNSLRRLTVAHSECPKTPHDLPVGSVLDADPPLQAPFNHAPLSFLGSSHVESSLFPKQVQLSLSSGLLDKLNLLCFSGGPSLTTPSRIHCPITPEAFPSLPLHMCHLLVVSPPRGTVSPRSVLLPALSPLPACAWC